MQVYRVVYEEDGRTVKAPGVSETEVRQCNLCYAAESIEEVWDAVDWIRNDPEKRLIAVMEEQPQITVLQSKH